MKFIAALFFLVAVIMAVAATPWVDRPPRPGHGGNGGIPTFPGQGPFNPKIPSGPWGKPGSKYSILNQLFHASSYQPVSCLEIISQLLFILTGN